ncbi:hypothetical protein LVJ82_06570 [Vitreoscilla massiliensis]|uniref:Uncharacterized protein n=1 Tax=Vitreoscilla massiliensis TaxID=1689272 RepID=A0ABY4E5S5_9NEIS|nr:hypothetical protein [Vitreoscilla massiliensis]UOO90634.1 hypothetical protein LVJ82_06570 [Vitreoscilla massiliensis]
MKFFYDENEFCARQRAALDFFLHRIGAENDKKWQNTTFALGAVCTTFRKTDS